MIATGEDSRSLRMVPRDRSRFDIVGHRRTLRPQRDSTGVYTLSLYVCGGQRCLCNESGSLTPSMRPAIAYVRRTQSKARTMRALASPGAESRGGMTLLAIVSIVCQRQGGQRGQRRCWLSFSRRCYTITGRLRGPRASLCACARVDASRIT